MKKNRCRDSEKIKKDHEPEVLFVRSYGPPLREYENEEQILEAMDLEVLRDRQLPER